MGAHGSSAPGPNVLCTREFNCGDDPFIFNGIEVYE